MKNGNILVRDTTILQNIQFKLKSPKPCNSESYGNTLFIEFRPVVHHIIHRQHSRCVTQINLESMCVC